MKFAQILAWFFEDSSKSLWWGVPNSATFFAITMSLSSFSGSIFFFRKRRKWNEFREGFFFLYEKNGRGNENKVKKKLKSDHIALGRLEQLCSTFSWPIKQSHVAVSEKKFLEKVRRLKVLSQWDFIFNP